MAKIIGNIDGMTVVEHDGVTEWADCAACGAHLDPATDASAPVAWDGWCYLCGAPASKVGLRAEVR